MTATTTARRVRALPVNKPVQDEKGIVFENETHWVLNLGEAGYEIFRIGRSQSVRVETIPETGLEGRRIATAEANRLNAI